LLGRGHTSPCLPTRKRVQPRNRIRENRSGSVRGALGNQPSYRERSSYVRTYCSDFELYSPYWRLYATAISPSNCKPDNSNTVSFKREIAMEAYLIENSDILLLDNDEFSTVDIIDAEIFHSRWTAKQDHRWQDRSFSDIWWSNSGYNRNKNGRIERRSS
jgi:hypothetical protein